MNMLLVLLFFWKILDLVVSITVAKFVPYLGFFSYGNTMLKYGLPDYVRGLSNFDGIFYIRIALHGYSQYEQAYFPLYPLLIKFITPIVGNNPIIAGVLISHVAFSFAIVLLYRYLILERMRHRDILWTLIFFLAYPTSFFFGVMYTESLFLLLFISIFYFLKQKKYLFAFVSAFFAGLTRVTGMFLVIPLAVFLVIKAWRTKGWIIRELCLLAGPLAGLLTYGLYLWKTTGDPFYFFSSQEHFGANRSTSLIFLPQVIYRYLRIFMTAQMNFQYFVAVVEFAFFITVLMILIVDLKHILEKRGIGSFRLALNLFSFTNLLVPALTGTLTAIPRYSMMSLSVFLFLGETKNATIKTLVLALFALLHILFFAFFMQGYYVT